jgi:hypothetical protein
MSRFAVFCDEGTVRLQATAVDMLSLIAWITRFGIVAASSLQPYFFAMLFFFETT